MQVTGRPETPARHHRNGRLGAVLCRVQQYIVDRCRKTARHERQGAQAVGIARRELERDEAALRMRDNRKIIEIQRVNDIVKPVRHIFDRLERRPL